MTTTALRDQSRTDTTTAAGPVSNALASQHPEVRVIVATAGEATRELPTTLPSRIGSAAAAVIVLASDGDPHVELWPAENLPVMVVFPPYASAAAVLAAFAAGADACIRTSSRAEVTAHLGALLRRTSLTSAWVS